LPGNPADATALSRTYRPLTAVRSKSKVAVSMSASASLQGCPVAYATILFPACGNERKPSSCFGGDRSADFGNCDPADLRLAPGGLNRQVIQREWSRLRRSDRADG